MVWSVQVPFKIFLVVSQKTHSSSSLAYSIQNSTSVTGSHMVADSKKNISSHSWHSFWVLEVMRQWSTVTRSQTLVLWFKKYPFLQVWHCWTCPVWKTSQLGSAGMAIHLFSAFKSKFTLQVTQALAFLSNSLQFRSFEYSEHSLEALT